MTTDTIYFCVAVIDFFRFFVMLYMVILMSCLEPNYMRCSLDGDTGALVYKFMGSAKMLDPRQFPSVSDLPDKGYYDFLIPCGKCSGCRMDYAKSWSDRMIVELKDNPKAIFVTLTYRNADLPYGDSGLPSLCVDDLQKFFKRLRKRFTGRRIRYYFAGEYGPRTHRPHYHGIIYGLSLDDFPDLKCFGVNELKQPYYTSPLFESIWSYGFVQLSEVTYHTCAYVSRYCLKKQSKQVYIDEGVVPEFNVSSRRPGIGMLHATDMVESGQTEFNFDGRDGSYTVRLPRAFIRHAKDAGSDVAASLLFQRGINASSYLNDKLSLTSQTFYDYLLQNQRKLYKALHLFPEREPERTV